MDTSRTIKSRQYDPISPIRRDGDRAWFESESRPGVEYGTERDPKDRSLFRCGCPARGLCKHITSEVLFHSRGLIRVSLWTSRPDAQRQKRPLISLEANGIPFYATCRLPPTQPDPDPQDRIDQIDQEIESLGQALVKARGQWYGKDTGRAKYQAQTRIQELNDRIAKLTRDRESLVVERRKQGV